MIILYCGVPAVAYAEATAINGTAVAVATASVPAVAVSFQDISNLPGLEALDSVSASGIMTLEVAS